MYCGHTLLSGARSGVVIGFEISPCPLSDGRNSGYYSEQKLDAIVDLISAHWINEAKNELPKMRIAITTRSKVLSLLWKRLTDGYPADS